MIESMSNYDPLKQVVNDLRRTQRVKSNIRVTSYTGGDLIRTDRSNACDGIVAWNSSPVPRCEDYRAWMNEFNRQYDDQGPRGYCWAYAVTELVEYWRWMNEYVKEQLDPMLVVKRGKEISGRHDSDGETLEVALQAAIEVFRVRATPHWIETITDYHCAIAFHGPVLMGSMITDAWNEVDASTGKQAERDGKDLGGHAWVGVGYDDRWGEVFGRTSWGSYGWEHDGKSTGFFRQSYSRFCKEWFAGVCLTR